MLHVASADATHQHYWSKATRQLGCSRRRLVVFAEICTWPKVVSTSVELLVTKAVVCRSLPGIGLASFICRQQFVRLHGSCVATSSASSLSSSSGTSPCFGLVHWARFVFVAFIRLAMPSSRFFRNALRISFARNTVTKGCSRRTAGV